MEWKDNREDVKWVQHLTGLPGHYEVLVSLCSHYNYLVWHLLMLLGALLVAGLISVACCHMHQHAHILHLPSVNNQVTSKHADPSFADIAFMSMSLQAQAEQRLSMVQHAVPQSYLLCFHWS